MFTKSIFNFALILAAGFVFSNQSAHAMSKKEYTAKKITIGQASFVGTGCPEGTASATLSPDNTTLSVIFDQFYVETTAYDPSIMNCQVVIPVSVPAGMAVMVPSVEFKGYNFLPDGGYSRFKGKLSMWDKKKFLGSRSVEKTWFDLMDSEFEVPLVDVNKPLVSGCGGNMTMAIDLSIDAGSNQYGDSVLAQVDSLDLTSRNDLKFKLYPTSCR